MVQTIENLQNSFAGIHLEDISAPKCFEIEEKLQQRLNIPVYHDDQEGTAIVVLAGLINAAKIKGKPLNELRVVINGVGASGVATAKLCIQAGITHPSRSPRCFKRRPDIESLPTCFASTGNKTISRKQRFSHRCRQSGCFRLIRSGCANASPD